MAAATALLVCACSAAAASALPTARACAEAGPGRAACMAERLLVGPTASSVSSAARWTAPREGALAQNKPAAGYLTPQLLREAYELPSETPAAPAQTIAIVDAYNDPTAEADLAVYSSQFALPPCTAENGCFEKVDQEGKASPLPEDEGGWASEISIDVQLAHGICPGCKILLVEANSEEFADLGAAVETAAKAGASVISNSYGGPEEAADQTLAAADYTHPGTVVLASSGDCGYVNEECPWLASAADFPADSPSVVAVGGTSLTAPGGVWSSSAWSGGGSGCSGYFSAGLWQSAAAGFAATGCHTGRAIADVSAIADPSTGVDIYDSTPERSGERTGWGVWGGTSVSAPVLAAEFALAGGAHGVADPAATLYAHLGEAGSLYDVSSGTNGTCASTTICRSVAGYDGPTGVGSPLGLGAFALAGSPESSSAPTVSGAPEQGQALLEGHGGWTGSPTGYSYQWERCGPGGKGCLAIPGATAQSYGLSGADVGSTLRVVEFAHNPSGTGAALSATSGPIASDTPAITSFTPASGITGSEITITGTALGSATQVLLGKLAASFTVLSSTAIEATVPDGALRGKLSVTTVHGTVTSKGKFATTFTVKSFKPLTAVAGTTVSIKGTGFNGSSRVRFAGTPAATTFLSKSKLKAIVPAGAGAGPLTVTNTEAPAGTVSSAASFNP